MVSDPVACGYVDAWGYADAQGVGPALLRLNGPCRQRALAEAIPGQGA